MIMSLATLLQQHRPSTTRSDESTAFARTVNTEDPLALVEKHCQLA